MTAEYDDPGWSSVTGNWFQRDLPYGIETLMENLFDPSHVPFAHHKIIVSGGRLAFAAIGIACSNITPVGSTVNLALTHRTNKRVKPA